MGDGWASSLVTHDTLRASPSSPPSPRRQRRSGQARVVGTAGERDCVVRQHVATAPQLLRGHRGAKIPQLPFKSWENLGLFLSHSEPQFPAL